MADDLDNESYDSVKALNTFLRVAATHRGVVVAAPLSYHDVRRAVEIDGEAVTPKEDADDALGEALVDGCERLATEERVGSSIVSVEPLQSIATLFDLGEPKALAPRCLVAYRARGGGSFSVCGVLVCCSFSAVEALSTSRFTPGYCRAHGLPRLDDATLLIDVVAASGEPRGVGALLVLACYLLACRSRKYERVATVAVTTGGKSLFRALGWEEHSYREGPPRTLFWCDTGDMTAQAVQTRLRLDGSVQGTCWRAGATPRTADKRYARC